MYPAYIQLVAKCSSPSICSARATGWWKYFKKIKIILKTRLELLLGKINIFLNHNFHKRPVEVEPLNWNLRDETARQTQMWTRSKLGISEHSCFLIFRNWQDQKMSVKLAHAIQSVKQWNKSVKEDMGTILFFAGRNWFHFGKKNNKTSRQENGMTWSCRLSIIEVCGLQNQADIT